MIDFDWDYEIDRTIASRLHNTALRATNKALGKAVVFAQGIIPVDTSSLKYSTRNVFGVPLPPYSEGGITESEMLIGGVDFSGRTMPETGKPGNDVDYAFWVNRRDLFLEASMANVPGDITRYLPNELR